MLAWNDEKNQAQIIRMLIAAGADHERTRPGGDTALAIALKRGQTGSAVVLLEAGADANVRIDRKTSLEYAMTSGRFSTAERLQLVQSLLAHGVSTNTSDGGEPLVCQALDSHNTAIAMALVEHNAPLGVCADGATPLIRAAVHTDTDVMKAILERGGVDVDAVDRGGHTALMIAAANGDAPTVSLLLASNARRDLVAPPGVTAAQIARISGHELLATQIDPAAGLPPVDVQKAVAEWSIALHPPMIHLVDAFHESVMTYAIYTTATESRTTSDLARIEAALRKEPKLRVFPPTPPKPTAHIELDSYVRRPGVTTLGHVADRLTKALNAAGYSGLTSYWVSGGGFALVSQREQVEADGNPNLQHRFGTMEPPKVFSLWSLLKAMTHADVGHYRIVAVVVTHQSLAFNPKAEADVVENLAQDGWAALPEFVKGLQFTSDFRCVGLIYEFVQNGLGVRAELLGNTLSGSGDDAEFQRTGLVAQLKMP